MLGDGDDPIRMGVQVDKARRDDEPARFDFMRRCNIGGFAGRDQRGDPATGDRDVRRESRRAAAVDDRAVANDQVVAAFAALRSRFGA